MGSQSPPPGRDGCAAGPPCRRARSARPRGRRSAAACRPAGPRRSDRSRPATRSARPPRPDDALGDVEALADGEDVLDQLGDLRRLGREAEQAAGGPGGGDHGVGAALVQQVHVLLLLHRGDDRQARVELPGGQGDEDGGVVAVGVRPPAPTPPRRRPRSGRPAWRHCRRRRPGRPRSPGRGPSSRGSIDDDLVGGSVPLPSRVLTALRPLSAVAADDRVVFQLPPPAGDAVGVSAPFGQDLQGGADEQDEEEDAGRGDEHGGDPAGAVGDRVGCRRSRWW